MRRNSLHSLRPTRYKSMRKRLFLKATPPWLARLLLVLMLSSMIALIIQNQQDWIAISTLILLLLAAPVLFCNSYLMIDYDKDFIEVRLCRPFWKHELRRYCGLKMAKAIRIYMEPNEDTTYLVFKNGDEIELPMTKDIEHILFRWYEHYFHTRLPIQKKKY